MAKWVFTQNPGFVLQYQQYHLNINIVFKKQVELGLLFSICLPNFCHILSFYKKDTAELWKILKHDNHLTKKWIETCIQTISLADFMYLPNRMYPKLGFQQPTYVFLNQKFFAELNWWYQTWILKNNHKWKFISEKFCNFSDNQKFQWLIEISQRRTNRNYQSVRSSQDYFEFR